MKFLRSLALICIALCVAACPGGTQSPDSPVLDAGSQDAHSDAGHEGSADDGGQSFQDGGVVGDGGTAGDDGGLVAGRCRTAQDCPDTNLVGIADCALPDPIAFPRGVCGACLEAEDECQTDTDCGAGLVCRGEGACGCGMATLICVDGCQTNADCLTGQTCNEDSHCVQKPCSSASDCPDQFECQEATQCTRMACSTDSDCADGGFCLQGGCFEEPGICFDNIPVP